MDEDELARAIPQGSALQESNAVMKLRKLMEDVSEKKKVTRMIAMNIFTCITFLKIGRAHV